MALQLIHVSGEPTPTHRTVPAVSTVPKRTQHHICAPCRPAHNAGYGRSACRVVSDCEAPFAFRDDGVFGAVLVDSEHAQFPGADDEVDVDAALVESNIEFLGV